MLNPMLSDSSTRSTRSSQVSDGYVLVDIEDIAGGVPASERGQIPNQLSTTHPESNAIGARPTLTASKLGQYFVFHCDLFLNRSAHPEYLFDDKKVEIGAIARSRIGRGFTHEANIFNRLRELGLLLDLRGTSDHVSAIVAELRTTSREEFYICGLEFPGEGLFDHDYGKKWGPLAPVRFGTVKPDLVKFEITETEGEKTARWWVIDAKASSKAKLSHFAQITFYTLALRRLFRSHAASLPTRFQDTGHGGVWLPDDGIQTWIGPLATDGYVPGLKTFPLTLVEPMITQLLFERIPEVVLAHEESVKWQLKPSCGSCPYLEVCERNALTDQILTSIPDLSTNDVTTLRRILARIPATAGSEVERLAALLNEPTASTYLNMEGSTTFARVGRVLRLEEQEQEKHLDSTSTSFSSPVLAAVLTRHPTPIKRHSLLLPTSKAEDVAIYMTALSNPATGRLAGWAGRVVRNGADVSSSGKSETSLVDWFGALMASLQTERRAQSTPLRLTVYVAEETEWNDLVNAVVREALAPRTDSASGAEDEDRADPVRLCLAILVGDSRLLATSVQPDLLGNLVDTGKMSKTQLANLARVVGVDEGTKSFDGRGWTKDTLAKAIRGRVGEGTASVGAGATEVTTARVVVVSEVAREVVAWPGPGWVDLERLVEWTGVGRDFGSGDVGIGLDQALEYFETGDNTKLSEILQRRCGAAFAVLGTIRRLVPPNLLSLPAPDFYVSFLDVVRTPSLRKLAFMNQLERSIRVLALRKGRAAAAGRWDGGRKIELECIAYRKVPGDDMKVEYIFAVLEGLEFIEVDQARLGKWLLVRDDPTEDVPVEMRFEDFKWFGVPVMPKSWNDEVDQATLTRITFANIVEMKEGWTHRWSDKGSGRLREIQDDRVCVVLDLPYKRRFCDVPIGKGKALFRLVERFTDFNLRKVMASIVDTELEAAGRQARNEAAPIFLRLLEDPNATGLASPVDVAVVHEDIDNFDRTSTFYNVQWALRGSELGKEAVRFRQSQARAFRAILRNKVTIVWGPPGSGKTHTLALSMLRLIELCFLRSNRKGCRVLMTAFTNAAVDTFARKFNELLRLLKQLKSLAGDAWQNSGWLDDLGEVTLLRETNVEESPEGGEGEEGQERNTDSGSRRPTTSSSRRLPPLPRAKYGIWAGTVWMIQKWLAKTSDKLLPSLCSFNILLIDEGSQLPVAEASIPTRLLLENDHRIVVAGDHLQLAPVLSGKYPAPSPSQPRLYGSIMECLMRDSRNQSFSVAEVLPQNSKRMLLSASDRDRNPKSVLPFESSSSFGPLTFQLSENFRMTSDLCAFIQRIYDAPFEPFEVPAPALSRKTLKDPPQHRAEALLDQIFEKPVKSLVTVRVKWRQSVDPATLPYESHVTEEAVLVLSLVRGLRADFPKERIFVVTPHRIQRAAIKEMLGGDTDDLMRIDTVERMQGDEADIVVVCYGFTTYAAHSGYSSVSDGELEFIFQRNRLNVALSRAKSLCIFIVADELFRRGPPFSVIASSERSDAWMFMSAFVDRSRQVEWTAGRSSTGDSDSDGGYNSQEYSNNSSLDRAFAELVLE